MLVGGQQAIRQTEATPRHAGRDHLSRDQVLDALVEDTEGKHRSLVEVPLDTGIEIGRRERLQVGIADGDIRVVLIRDSIPRRDAAQVGAGDGLSVNGPKDQIVRQIIGHGNRRQKVVIAAMECRLSVGYGFEVVTPRPRDGVAQAHIHLQRSAEDLADAAGVEIEARHAFGHFVDAGQPAVAGICVQKGVPRNHVVNGIRNRGPIGEALCVVCIIKIVVELDVIDHIGAGQHRRQRQAVRQHRSLDRGSVASLVVGFGIADPTHPVFEIDMAKGRRPGFEAVLRAQPGGDHPVAFLHVGGGGIEAGTRALAVSLIESRIGHIRAVGHEWELVIFGRVVGKRCIVDIGAQRVLTDDPVEILDSSLCKEREIVEHVILRVEGPTEVLVLAPVPDVAAVDLNVAKLAV